MYDKYFGLNGKPFSIAPDPRYLFMSEQHREALAHLVYGVGDGGGFVLLTGEVGTGKTTVCRCLLEQLPGNTRIAYILNPKLSAIELLANVCDELHIPYSEQPSLKQLTDVLNKFLLASHGAGLKIVLMIDEAQNLSIEVLEQIRLLTNLETNKEKLLQIILIGQPELKDILAKHELRQLAQRITARYHLRPLTAEESESYILHRLEVSGFSESLFDKKAIHELYKRTAGVPRLINVLCDRAMLGAYAKNLRQIGPKVIRQAASEVMGGNVHEAQADIIKPVHTPGQSLRWTSYSLAIFLIVVSSYAIYLFNQQLVIEQDVQKLSQQQQETNQQSKIELNKLADEKQQLQNTIDKMQEELSAKPKAMLPFLPDEIQPTDRAVAMQQLLQRWNIDYQPERDGEACEFALSNQMRCEFESGDWWLLSMIDRPVVLKLLASNGQPIYGVLLAMEQSDLLINFAGKEFRLTKNQVSSYWEGEYYLLWQTPPNYQQPLSISMSGAAVQWLVTSLAKLENLDLIVPPNTVYDDQLKTRVKKFQTEHSLIADGVAGPYTLITLNSLTNNTPKLSISFGAN